MSEYDGLDIVFLFVLSNLFLSNHISKSYPLPKYWKIFIYIFPLLFGTFLLIDLLLLSPHIVYGQDGDEIPFVIVGYLILLTILMVKHKAQKTEFQPEMSNRDTNFSKKL